MVLYEGLIVVSSPKKASTPPLVQEPVERMRGWGSGGTGNRLSGAHVNKFHMQHAQLRDNFKAQFFRGEVSVKSAVTML